MEKLKLPGGQVVTQEYVEKLSRLILAFTTGICRFLPENQSLFEKLRDLERVIRKTLDEQEPSGLHKEVHEFFDNKKMEEEFRILEKEGLVEVVRELTKGIKDMIEPTGAFDQELNQFVQAIEKTDNLMDIRAIKARIIEKTRSVQKGFLTIRAELEKSYQTCQKLQKQLHDAEARVIIDSLTRVLNRTAYEMKIVQFINNFNRTKVPASMAVLDIDHFKAINEKYGHEAGDNVLRSISFLIRDSLRESDMVFRYGGEEFVVLFNKTDQKGAQQVAEKIRSRVENVRTHLVNDVYADKDKRVKITISIGLSQAREGDSAETLFKRASGALLRAKSQGRNVVMIS